MTAVKAYYDGRAFVPMTPISAEKNQQAIITILDTDASGQSKDFSLNFLDGNHTETGEEVKARKERLLSLAGSISHTDYLEIEKALEETERIFPNEW
jgi:hypothetical protein